jgi:hypothetical protein
LIADATVLAGVPHLIPAAFGLDTRLDGVRDLPHLAQHYIKSETHMMDVISKSQGRTKYTIIHTGPFLEWALQYNIFLNLGEKGEGVTVIFDDGNARMSVSSMHDIGEAIATAVLKRDQPGVQNKILLMHNIIVSQNETLELAKEIMPDKPWPTQRINTLQAWAMSQKAFDESGGTAPASAYQGFFAKALARDGLGLFEQVDNDILDVPDRDKQWLKGILERYLVK